MLYLVAPPLFEGRPEVSIYKDIVDECEKRSIEFKRIEDSIYRPVELGGVYTSPVMLKYYNKVTLDLTLQIKDGDSVFWVDGWNPSLPTLWHYCTAEHIKVKNVGIWHSSPTTNGDYLFGSKWAEDFQNHIIKFMDKIFVATQSLKDSIITSENKDNMIVTGLPFDKTCLKPSKDRIDRIVFGHRWAQDKRCISFLKLAKKWEDKPIEFSVFSPYHVEQEVYDSWVQDSFLEFPTNVKIYNNLSKEKYYEELGKSKWVFADSQLETFGYFILEGILSGCIPWLNFHPCYVELYGKNACYYNYHEQEDFNRFSNPKRWNSNVSRIHEIIGSSVDKMLSHLL